MLMRHTISAAFMATVLLAGCSSDDDNSDTPVTSLEMPADSGASGETSMPAPGTDLGAPVVTTSEFNGNFFRGCSVAEDPEDGFEIIEIMIQDDLVVTMQSEFSDAQCTQQTFGIVLESSVTFPGDTVDTPFGVAEFIDITVETATVNGTPSVVPQESTMVFDLILLDGNNLFFGDTSGEFSGETSETRPMELDASFALVRL